MGDQEVIPFYQWVATLGVGGVLAAFMFIFYRKDMKENTDSQKGQIEILLTVVKENTAAITANTEIIRNFKYLEDRN